MTLQEWMGKKKLSPVELAHLMGLSNTVNITNWCNRAVTPKLEHYILLRDISKGRLKPENLLKIKGIKNGYKGK